jgi:hypothetical protein
VEKGALITLESADASATAHSLEGCHLAHESLRKALVTRLDQNSSFVGLAKSAPGFAIDTLPSIRWHDDQVFLFGPVASSAP